MDWSCLIYYPIAAILGGILSWLIFSDKRQLKELELSSNRDKAAFNDIRTEFSTFKKDQEAKVNIKSAEIDLLKKKLKAANANPVTNIALKSELEKSKRQTQDLQTQLSTLKSNGTSTSTDSKEIKNLKKANQSLKVELKTALDALINKDDEIEALAANSGDVQESQHYQALLDSQTQKIAKLKAKLKAKQKELKKASKSSKSKPSHKDLIKSLDIKKLADFLQDENSYKA